MVTDFLELPLFTEQGNHVAIQELLTCDPTHARERAAVVDAIREVALDNGGEVNPNLVRPLIPEWVGPRVVSAVYGALSRRKVLVFARWGVNLDEDGGNNGKPARIYRWSA